MVQQEPTISTDIEDREDPTSSFTGLNGLEIAAVADCKKFLSQRIVQKIVHGIVRNLNRSSLLTKALPLCS